MTVAIRRAHPAERDVLAAAGALTRRVFISEGFISEDNSYVAELDDARSRAESAELFVAQDEAGTVVGTVTFAAAGSPYAELSAAGEGEFRMLVVSPAARGQGLGERLARTCVDRGRELGLSAMVLSTQPSMRAAHHVYEALGFVRDPALDWEPQPGLSLVAFRLVL